MTLSMLNHFEEFVILILFNEDLTFWFPQSVIET